MSAIAPATGQSAGTQMAGIQGAAAHEPAAVLHICRQDSYQSRALVPGEALPDGLVWVDLVNPTPEQEQTVEAWIGVDLPPMASLRDITASRRFRRKGRAAILILPLLVQEATGHAHAEPVGFILVPELLVTLRATTPASFRSFVEEIDASRLDCPESVLIGLVEAVMGEVSDVLERTAAEVAPLARRAYAATSELGGRGRRADQVLQALIRALGREGDSIAVLLDALIWLDPIAEFLTEVSGHSFEPRHLTRIRAFDRDIAALARHGEGMSTRIQILLETAMGAITLRQSVINKILSIVAVVFMPPTLVGTVYGMNFANMPELAWPWGYPMALGVMGIAAVVPYLLFRWRGWL
ncbi:CorA family divalent cation transporter [Zavarzinia sp. CC-PAN008]|uniref:CorA family divalent cation transporter n=1 Tax=Zavarzinia sp. CC-PAN008 TaxID=3243332 RepID=UPI003F746DFB